MNTCDCKHNIKQVIRTNKKMGKKKGPAMPVLADS